MKAVEVSFAPVNNQRLAHLCGALDENLRQIESALDVIITRRGELFTVNGEPRQTRLAAQALKNFYAQARRHLSVEDVQLGLVEVAREPPAPDTHGAPQLKTRRSDLHGRTPRQVQYLKQILEHDITFAIGPAGTGKTYLAMAAAVSALLKNEVERIILTRPAVEAGETLGFLPGDLREKILPYLRPLYDALNDMLDAEDISRLTEKGVIEIAPLAYMRGRTLSHAFVVLDEAQNTTAEQMMMFLTRLGEDSRMVITGDITQIDLPRSKASGLLEVRHILSNIPGIDFHTFSGSDVVRHPLVGKIIEAYENYRNPLTSDKSHASSVGSTP